MLYVQLKAIFRAIISFKENTLGMHWDNEHGANISGDASSSTFDNYVSSSKVCFGFLITSLCIYFIIQCSQTSSLSPFTIKAGPTWRRSRTLFGMLPQGATRCSQPCIQLLQMQWIRQSIWTGLTHHQAHLIILRYPTTTLLLWICRIIVRTNILIDL